MRFVRSKKTDSPVSLVSPVNPVIFLPCLPCAAGLCGPQRAYFQKTPRPGVQHTAIPRRRAKHPDTYTNTQTSKCEDTQTSKRPDTWTLKRARRPDAKTRRHPDARTCRCADVKTLPVAERNGKRRSRRSASQTSDVRKAYTSFALSALVTEAAGLTVPSS